MDDLIRLIIPNERLENNMKNNLILTKYEAHYINKVMRIKIGQEILIINGKGSLWRAIKIKNNEIMIKTLDKPFLFEERKKFLLGIAVVIPKSGFEPILRMCTELGIDFIQPLSSERQVKKISNISNKLLRWDSIINEAVEQCERLWKPFLLNDLDILEWIDTYVEKDFISISVTRENECESLYEWLKIKQNMVDKKGAIFWNVIGPEGGWSKNEINYFNKKNISFVKLSDNILRTSTASINATSLLNKWRDDNLKLVKNL